jgi:hypothetical protein
MSLCDSCSFAVEMDGDYTARLAKVGVLRLRPGPDGPAWWRVRADSAGVMQRPQELEMHSAHSRGSPVDREWRLCISADFGAGENVYVGNRVRIGSTSILHLRNGTRPAANDLQAAKSVRTGKMRVRTCVRLVGYKS